MSFVRRLACLPVMLLAFASGGQADDRPLHADAGQTVERSIEHAKHDRTYRLHLPAGLHAGEAVPLVIALHGLSMDGESMEALTGLSEVADEKGFIAVYPDGLGRMWRFWERHELGQRVRSEFGYVDEVGFIEALIDSLISEGLVDGRRVYVTGLSNGAYMTNRLASSLSDRIAAVAPVAGTMSPAISNLDAPRPMPFLYIHGTDDRIVGFDGVDSFTGIKSSLDANELVAWWCDHNGCRKNVTGRPLPDTVEDGCRVMQTVFESEQGAPVVFYEVTDGGHTWPGGDFQPERLLGPVCRDFKASELMWEFFSHYSLPEAEAPAAP
ncbi:MAG: prolyl oligopeptidase family serine peptidase [Planctomycetaceae bacterium]|nr:prolyl oligopeptidase family serine peptidase [Planctomycetaceae bacterium]